jgi:filamentous hemagglutinin family protein
MKISLGYIIKICLYSVSLICVGSKISLAQVTSDNTVDTQVNQNGNVSEITGGETRDDNLFHSFEEFSVTTGNEAFFNNANEISNIFSRVTGESVSQIDGLIRANGSANLFLINPAGIIFNENASLDIGGSFLATTASSIQFEQGEFSAIAPEEKPILTISVPIGLNFEENPGGIINNSVANEGQGLTVSEGNDLSLLGGDLNFEAGRIAAPGGKINLGGLSAAGTISINDEGSFIFPDNVAPANLSLKAGVIDVRGNGDGSIKINAGNVDLRAGDAGSSVLSAGVAGSSNTSKVQAGDITIDATNKITVDNSFINNHVEFEAVGDAGGIMIDTGSLSLTNGGQVNANTYGQGNAGSVEITAQDTIAIDGESSTGCCISGVGSVVTPKAVGNVGGIMIDTGSLSLTNGGRVDASTYGQGNAGSVEITAQDTIAIDGNNSSTDFISGVGSVVAREAVGDAGRIMIETDSLFLTNGGQVNSGTYGQGNAGSIEITAQDAISLTNESQISVSTLGQGDAGNIFLQAEQSIMLDNNSIIFNSVEANATGNGGKINITTTNLDVIKSQINADSSGTGNVGSILIKADSLLMNDGEIYAENDAEESITDNNALEASGNVTLEIAKGLILRNDSDISTEAEVDAAGGNVNINAGFIIILADEENEIRTNAELGKGGNIAINTPGLFVPNSSINASSNLGIDGTIKINTPDLDLQKELEQSELEILTTEKAIASSCLARNNQQGSFTVNNSPGAPKSPDSNYSDTDFTLTGMSSLPTTAKQPEAIEPNNQPSNTSMLPAEKMVETKNGRIFLVAAPYAKRYPLGPKPESLLCPQN